MLRLQPVIHWVPQSRRWCTRWEWEHQTSETNRKWGTTTTTILLLDTTTAIVHVHNIHTSSSFFSYLLLIVELGGWMDGWRVFLMRSSRASDSDSLSANWTRWGGEEKLGPELLYSWCCLHNDGVLNGSNMKYLEYKGKNKRGIKYLPRVLYMRDMYNVPFN